MDKAEADRRITTISRMREGLAKAEAAQHIVTEIETDGPREALPYALFTLISALVWNQECVRAYVPFTRLTREWEEHPELFDDVDQHSFFWAHKWMVASLSEYPTVPREQIERTIADMARRFAEAGNGMDAVEHLRFGWARRSGAADVDERFRVWVTTPRDDFSQCVICDPAEQADYLYSQGRVEEAIDAITRVLAANEPNESCASEPQSMLATLALANLDVGRTEEAVRAHRRGLASLTGEQMDPLVVTRAEHVLFLARTGNADRALALLRDNEQILTEAESPWDERGLARTLGAALQILIDAGHGDRLLGLAVVRQRTVAELAEHLRDTARRLDAVFDARDGHEHHRADTDRVWAATALAERVDLEIDVVVPTTAEAGSTAPPPSTSADLDETRSRMRTAAREAASGSAEKAVRSFAELGRDLIDAGELEQALEAYRSAAAAAARIVDFAAAATAQRQVVALARAMDRPLQDRAAFTSAAAGFLAQAGDADRALDLAASMRSELSAALAPGEIEFAVDDGAGVDRASIERADAEMQDTSARVLATLGRFDEATEAAFEAGERLGEAGAIASASYAFLLGGTICAEHLGDSDRAIWAFESAVEGFTIARNTSMRTTAASRLIRALRSNGRGAEADEVAREL